jgi:membrane-associated protease RseP (regulator of RpoE activity)
MKWPKGLTHIALFLVTLLSTTLAGAEWMYGRFFLFVDNPLGLSEFWQGLHFSVPFLAFLTFHEFGHYFTAKYYQLKVSLPYYIPVWLSGLSSIGTMGAVIRLRETPKNNLQYFDIGIAGPLAGFVIALGVLWYGFTHLPPPEHIFNIHPEYSKFGLNYAKYVYQNQEGQIAIGNSFIFSFFKKYVASNPAWVPNPYEIMHYPYLFAGFLGLFFTSLNLLPIGQLDGGHILCGLLGHKTFNRVSVVFFTVFVFYGGLGIFRISDFHYLRVEEYFIALAKLLTYGVFLYLCFSKVFSEKYGAWIMALSIILVQLLVAEISPSLLGYSGFLPFGLLLGRFLGVKHPVIDEEVPISGLRKVLGWLAILIFVLCASPSPFIVY